MSRRYRGWTVAERAAKSARMREAWRAGKFATKRKSIRPDHWTPAHDRRLQELLPEHSAAACAAILSAEFPGTPRTPTAVLLRAKRQGLPRPASGTYTAQQLGRLFGVDPSTVSKSWMRRGWLARARLTPTPTSAYCVPTAALEQFIRDYPHVYDWRAMRPSRWRSLAEMVWRRDPLLPVDQAARVVGCAPETLRRYLRRGLVVGYRRPLAGAHDCWLIRRSALRALELEAPGSPGFRRIPRTEAERLVAQWRRTQGQAAWAGRRRRALERSA